MFENVKIVRGMEGYGWFANIISTTRTSLTSNTRSISGSDDKTGEEIPLQFVEMNRPIRHLKKGGEHFACTDFRKPGQEGRVLRHRDFLLDEKTGKLKVCNIKMHKVPVQEDGIWMQVPRYTFESMDFEETN
ncbi:MAG: hypothetical protein ACREDO_07590 [Methyloceanibacter sp.]